jgi:hypothetical protein
MWVRRVVRALRGILVLRVRRVVRALRVVKVRRVM